MPPDRYVTGLVERYGRAVVGPWGWRAEHVVIRGLVAATTELAAQLEQRYPAVEVVYRPLPEEVTCVREGDDADV